MGKLDELVENVKKRLNAFPNLADSLAKIDGAALAIMAQDAIEQARNDHFAERSVPMAATYLLAHYVVMTTAEGSNVAKEQVDVISREYFDRRGSDDYLAEYRRMMGNATVRFL